MTLLAFPKKYDWHHSLKKSPLSPPPWVFYVVWPILYFLIALSLYNYLQTTGFVYTKGLLYFGIQLVANLLWLPLFLGQRSIKIALIDVVVMCLFTYLAITEFNEVNKEASMMLYPYLSWLLFAMYLNGYMVVKNPEVKEKRE